MGFFLLAGHQCATPVGPVAKTGLNIDGRRALLVPGPRPFVLGHSVQAAAEFWALQWVHLLRAY